MRSDAMNEFYAIAGVSKSRSRPRMSNDNSYSEALFKTAKYVPLYPGSFETLDAARTWFGCLGGRLNTCQLAGIRRGTATSIPTSFGATSPYDLRPIGSSSVSQADHRMSPGALHPATSSERAPRRSDCFMADTEI